MKILVVLNNDIYELSESHYDRIFKINKQVPKKLAIFDELKHREEHEKTCNAIRKHGKLIGMALRVLRDD